MKNLSANQTKVLNVLFSKFLSADETKKENLQKEIIAKFGIENFENAIKLNKKIVAPIAEIKKDAITETEMQNENSDAQITNDLLSALNAIGITDKLKEKGGKSIFKKEFNNKTDRTSCRNKFQNLISVYLLHIAHNKADLAGQKLIEINAIAQKYYVAEISFTNVEDYASTNMDENKRALVGLFIKNQKEIKELI
jgi:hypothetical protein